MTSEFLKELHEVRDGSGNTEQWEVFYDKYAVEYDALLNNLSYTPGTNIANLLVKYLEKSALLLDVACGTGDRCKTIILLAYIARFGAIYL